MTRTPLTPIEEQVYHFLLDFLAERTFQPSVREIAERFSIASTKSVADLLEFVAQGGARCSVPMRHGSAKGGSQHSSCIENGKMRFEVSVSNSVGASYESFDLATDVGCITFDGARHSQYFVARDANWNLLTHDKALAATLLQLRGVTVATGGCPVDASTQPGLTGPMRPN